eukprot:196516-Chlamydomonas_euryale.AAC.1
MFLRSCSRTAASFSRPRTLVTSVSSCFCTRRYCPSRPPSSARGTPCICGGWPASSKMSCSARSLVLFACVFSRMCSLTSSGTGTPRTSAAGRGRATGTPGEPPGEPPLAPPNGTPCVLPGGGGDAPKRMSPCRLCIRFPARSSRSLRNCSPPPAAAYAPDAGLTSAS